MAKSITLTLQDGGKESEQSERGLAPKLRLPTSLFGKFLLGGHFEKKWFAERGGGLCLNPTAQKDNRGVLGASFRVEQISEIVGYSNMADYTSHIICECASGKTMFISKTSTFFYLTC